MNHQADFSKTPRFYLNDLEEGLLLDRLDLKFLLPIESLISVTELLAQSYKILEVKERTSFRYETQYWDTENFDFFKDHQRGKWKRNKVRHRVYADTPLSFFELKQKFNGRTIKLRQPSEVPGAQLSAQEKAFLTENNVTHDLIPSLCNNFKRRTFLSFDQTERITLDVDIRFTNPAFLTPASLPLENLAVLEVKQLKVNRNSPILCMLKKMQLRPSSFSKYCIGLSLLHPELKANRFKEVYLTLRKMNIQL